MDQQKQNLIKAFVFDLGNVLFPFDITKVLFFLQKFNPQINRETTDRLEKIMRNYELGKISSGEFFQSVKDETGYPGTFEEFRFVFCHIFEENPEVVSIALKLKKNSRFIYCPIQMKCISNILKIHSNGKPDFRLQDKLTKWDLDV